MNGEPAANITLTPIVTEDCYCQIPDTEFKVGRFNVQARRCAFDVEGSSLEPYVVVQNAIAIPGPQVHFLSRRPFPSVRQALHRAESRFCAALVATRCILLDVKERFMSFGVGGY